jgi:UDP-GlcNAc:undecaprenyl-phosphate/decaprenyl-phosphate GlcNAc-1-phosphate transferase
MNSVELGWFLAACLLPSLIISWLATNFMIRMAPRWGLVDHPAARKVHVEPKPLGGGIAIVSGILLPFLIGQLLLWLVQWQVIAADSLPLWVREHLPGMLQKTFALWCLLMATFMLMLLGLLDDRYAISWKIRLTTQFLIASLCVAFVPDVRLTCFLHAPMLTAILTVLWIVILINAFNMLDNMNGLSAGVAGIAALVLASLLLGNGSSTQPQLFVAGLLFVVAGSSFGFLYWNYPQASIFMGDAGSYALGFLLAVGTLLATFTTHVSGTPHAILTPLCLMAVPLYDFCTVLLIRLWNRKSLFEADKNHFSHRLVALGFTPTQAVATIWLLSFSCSLGGWLLSQTTATGAMLVAGIIGCNLLVIALMEFASRHTNHLGTRKDK